MSNFELYNAAYAGDHETVENILKTKDCDVNFRNIDRNGETPLYAAASRGTDTHLKVMELLLVHGADVNLDDNRKQTPLYVAASWGNCDAVRLLIVKGADVNLKYHGGQTALHVAVQGKPYLNYYTNEPNDHDKEKKMKDLIALALRTMETSLKEYSTYLPNFHEDYLMLAKNSKISHDAGVVAAYYNYFGVVAALVEADADINASDDRNHTALDKATLAGHGAVIKFLLGKGAM